MREAHLSLGEELAAKGDAVLATRQAEDALALTGAPELEPEDFQRVYGLLAFGKSPQAALVRKEAAAFGIDMAPSGEAPGWQVPTEAEPEAFAPHNLPVPTTSFVGRDPELLEIARLLEIPHCRIITVHGPGGVGKSRLAIESAFGQVRGSSFQDGVYFVPLVALTSPEQIPMAIATVLGLTLEANEEPLERIKAYLGAKRVLLVLDNYEQLLSGATLPVELIEACANLQVLVTSRVRLNLAEEHVVSLEGLPLPLVGSSFEDAVYAEALRLLVQRGKKARLDFHLGPEELPEAVKLCALLDGSPLGIELAMAWVRLMPLGEILMEVERNLDFLESLAHNVPERHHSLRAVFEHSWALLSPREQRVLRRLAVFRGGFRREAASAVAGATLPILVSLVDRSMVRVLPNGRFDQHALLYRFTSEKLAENPDDRTDAQEQHAAYFLALAEEVEPHLEGPEQSLWLPRLEAEHDNVRAVLSWALQSDRVEPGLRLAGSLGRFWDVGGHYYEGRDWLDETLAHPGASARSQARFKALDRAGLLAHSQGDYTVARTRIEQSVAASRELGNKRGIANELKSLEAFIDLDAAAASALIEESLALSRKQGDRRGIATALNYLGQAARDQGDLAAERSHFEESLSISRELGDKLGISASLTLLGETAQNQGDLAAARSLYEESLAVSRELGNKQFIGHSLIDLGKVAQGQGDLATARTHFEESIATFQDAGDKRWIGHSLSDLGMVVHDQGEVATALLLFEESLALYRELGNAYFIAYSLEHLAIVTHDQGDLASARTHLEECLTIRWELGDRRETVSTLYEWAILLASEGLPERAAHLWGAAEALREALDFPLYPNDLDRRDRAVVAAREQLGEAAFTAAWKEGGQFTLDEAVSYALNGGVKATG